MTTSSNPTGGLRSPKPHGGQPIPENEVERLGAVVGLNQVHSESQPALVALRNTAQRLFHTPVAFIGMIEEETQRLLTVCIAPQGAEATTPAADFKEMVTPRDCSICQYTIMFRSGEFLITLAISLSVANLKSGLQSGFRSSSITVWKRVGSRATTERWCAVTARCYANI